MNKITPAQLRPADVLLYHGDGLVSRLIRLFDGGQYSHSSIYDGSNITEAIGSGITTRSVAESCGEVPYVDVYRYVGSDGGALGAPDAVVARIQSYQANRERYAYEAIVLLAALAATRRLPIPVLGPVLRNILDAAADVLARLIAAGREPMICSELVFRCYDEAAPPAPILIRGADIQNIAALPLASTAGTAEEIELQRSVVDFLSTYAIAKRAVTMPASMATGGGVATASVVMSALDAAVLAVANFVTPRDLSRSPNLNLVGRLAL